MRVCLYGAGSNKIEDKYLDEGYLLGKSLSENNHSLVFGAGSGGMMGAVSRGFRDNSGEILGISTVFMKDYEDICDYCSEIIYAKSMDERKKLFVEKSDCFIVAPGGIGTLDEFFEVLTLKRLERFDKPIIIFNVYGFYESLFNMIEDIKDKGFISEDFDDLFFVACSVDEILEFLDL